MCQYEYCKNLKFAGNEAVVIDVSLRCPACKVLLIEEQENVHFGGETWEPVLRCNCGWSMTITVKPRTVFLAKKGYRGTIV
jgi:hypothetical protein